LWEKYVFGAPEASLYRVQAQFLRYKYKVSTLPWFQSSFSALRYADVAQLRPKYVACREKTGENGSELPSNKRFSCFQDGGSTPDWVMQCNGNSSVAHVSEVG